MKDQLERYRDEMQKELRSILGYWMEFAVDKLNGGFIGRIDHFNKIYDDAPKGSVLNSRILWTFSSAYRLTKDPSYLEMAERAFQYIPSNFLSMLQYNHRPRGHNYASLWLHRVQWHIALQFHWLKHDEIR